MFQFKKIIALTLLLLSTTIFAAQPIPVNDAFQFSATVNKDNTISTHWKIAPGYHLYRDRFCFKMLEPTAHYYNKLVLPAGIPKQDDILGKYQVFNNSLNINIPISKKTAKQVTMLVCYQGCSDSNFCYPPVTKQFTVNLTDIGETVKGHDASPVTPTTIAPISEQDKITQLLSTSSFGWILLSFFGFGILLTFTPCVLPMIPILSGIIVGHNKKVSHSKAFLLSLIYVLSMAVTYALAGIAAGFAGQSIQTAFQNPWVIITFSFIFVLLAFSLFGFYELRLPSSLLEKLGKISHHQKSGSYIGVAIMGCLATLIVSPCVTAPLIGALAYIGNTGDAVLGGSALFVMALGMGIPLLIIGTSHATLLPRAGAWMNTVKSFFGVLMLGVAIWMLSRIIPPHIVLLLWAGLLLVCSIYMGLMHRALTGWQKFWKGIAFVFAIYGIFLMIGFATGNSDPLKPLASFSTEKLNGQSNITVFQPVKSVSDFDIKLQQGMHNNQITMLDFYADWCIACKEMEHKTFNNAQVAMQLQSFNTLQANITNNDILDKALMKKYDIIAPPAILFFDNNGNEIKSARIIGEMDAKTFLQHLSQVRSLTQSRPTTQSNVVSDIEQPKHNQGSLIDIINRHQTNINQ